MKKLFKILGTIIIAIVAAVAAVPYLFSDQIESAVKEEINALVEADVDYNDFSLSIFSSFPDLRASLNGISVIGRDRFKGDTLAYIGSLSADVKIMPLLDGDIAINSINIVSPVVRGIVAADSLANWDIYKSDTDTIAVEDTTASAPLKVDLKSVKICDADIKYIDSTMNMIAHIIGLDLDLQGKLNGDIFTTNLALDIPAINVEMDNITYLKKADVDFDANIEADLANSKYTMKENQLKFCGIPLAFDGFVQLRDSSTLVDMRLAANETNFKTLLAIIPEAFMKDIEGLKMDGTFELFADVKGEYIDMANIPAINAAFKVNNGQIKYPDLPKSLDDINVDVTIKNPSGDADLTTVDVNKLHFALASNPFDASLSLIKPLTNPTFKAHANGTIDLNSLKDALPLDSMTIAGIIKANLSVAADMAAIDKEDYENIKAEGSVNLANFSFQSNDLPQGINISEAKLVFTPKFLQVDPLKATLGKSDFNATGKVENYMSYVLSDGTIKGALNLQSNLIDCNELLGNSSSTTTDSVVIAPTDTTIVLIPSNIDFALNTDIKKVLYDNLTITNIKGAVAVKESIAKLNNLALNLCDGSVALSGIYNKKNQTKPSFDMNIALNEVDVNMLTNSFSTVDSLLPIAKKAHGKISIAMDLLADLDYQMSPIMKTINGKGSFKSQSLSLKESDFQKKLAKAISSDKFNNLTMKDFKGSFTIVNGEIVVVPFDIKMFDKKATFSGKQGLDQTMAYLMSMPFTREEISSLVSKTGISIPASFTSGADIPVGINIGGTLRDPKVSINIDELKAAVASEVKAKVEEKATEVVEKVKDRVAEELNKNEDVKKVADKAKDALNNLFKKK